MPDSSVWRMANKLAGGKLERELRRRRGDQGHKYDRIARELYAEYGIEVTRQAIALWCADLGITPKEDS